jgi:hypothetical protein
MASSNLAVNAPSALPPKRPHTGGRKPGSMSIMSRDAHDRAAATGELPHEFLLRVARGDELFDDYVNVDGDKVKIKRFPTFAERVDAAKAAAPYFQPRLATTDVNHRGAIALATVAEAISVDMSVAIAKEMLLDAGYVIEG